MAELKEARARRRARVIAISRIAHGMKIRTIAELVGSDEILQALREISVHYAQGCGIPVPQPLQELA